MDALGLAMVNVFGSDVLDGSGFSLLFLLFYFGVPIATLVIAILIYQRCDISSIPLKIKNVEIEVNAMRSVWQAENGKRSQREQDVAERIASIQEDVRGLNNSINTPASKARAETDTTDILFAYKKFLDAGVISQDEFDKKKREILWSDDK